MTKILPPLLQINDKQNEIFYFDKLTLKATLSHDVFISHVKNRNLKRKKKKKEDYNSTDINLHKSECLVNIYLITVEKERKLQIYSTTVCKGTLICSFTN